VFDVPDEVGPMSEGAEETFACAKLSPEASKLVGRDTDIEMIPVFFRWKLASFCNHTMPSIVGPVLMDLFRHCV
jgi:hypothetical protein